MLVSMFVQIHLHTARGEPSHITQLRTCTEYIRTLCIRSAPLNWRMTRSLCIHVCVWMYVCVDVCMELCVYTCSYTYYAYITWKALGRLKTSFVYPGKYLYTAVQRYWLRVL